MTDFERGLRNSLSSAFPSATIDGCLFEAWNKQFAAQVGHAHPTIWNFLAAVYIEQSSTDEKFLFEANGDEPPRRKKRYVTRDRRIEHLVQSYQPDLDKLIPYLDSLRNLMIEN